MKSVRLNYQQHQQLVEHIKNNHPPSTLLIRERMKQRLGFTIRFATGRDIVFLDFVDESRKAWFLLKWESLFE